MLSKLNSDKHIEAELNMDESGYAASKTQFVVETQPALFSDHEIILLEKENLYKDYLK